MLGLFVFCSYRLFPLQILLAVGSTAIAQVYLFAFAFKIKKNKYDSKDNTLLLAE